MSYANMIPKSKTSYKNRAIMVITCIHNFHISVRWDMSEKIRSQELTGPEQVHIPDFGEFNVIPAINAEGCVDPRESLTFVEPKGELATFMNHNPAVKRIHHHDGAERSPGASFGKAMSLAGAVPGLSPQQAVDIVTEWEESEERKFTLHEDDHAYHVHGLGCGHVDKACMVENEAAFGLPSEKVQAMKEYVLQKTGEREMTVEVPMLTKNHREKGVLVVLSDDKTVEATDGKNDFFRFDATRHDRSLERLADFAQTKGIAVLPSVLKASAEKQRNAVLGLLAPGLPVYLIDLRQQRQQKEVVTFLQKIPQPTTQVR